MAGRNQIRTARQGESGLRGSSGAGGLSYEANFLCRALCGGELLRNFKAKFVTHPFPD